MATGTTSSNNNVAATATAENVAVVGGREFKTLDEAKSWSPRENFKGVIFNAVYHGIAPERRGENRGLHDTTFQHCYMHEFMYEYICL